MKHLISAAILFLGVNSACASDLKEEGDFAWTRTFTLQSGTQVYHGPDLIAVGNFSSGRSISFSKGMTFGSDKLTDDFNLKRHSTVEEFRKEVLKLGPIAWEK